MQEKMTFFTALTSTAIAVAPRIGQAETPFNGRGLTTVWNVCGPASFDFAVGYSRGWRASLRRNGARLATVCDYFRCGCVSPERFHLPLRSIRARFASRRAAQKRCEAAAAGATLPSNPHIDCA